ncbi:MAG: hypothetical protein JO301_12215 [Chitinophagaceae bacterium]|nr:hypothetical protein [Chitinophagaceae bacterium]
MDAKITLSFDEEVISKAKAFAEENNISLSRLTEYLYRNITSRHYPSLEALPLASWVSEVAEGQAEYITKPSTRGKQKQEFFKSKKRK